MANTGKQSPLGVNVLGSVLQNRGLDINPIVRQYMGSSKINGYDNAAGPGGGSGYSLGQMVRGSCLFWLTHAIHDAYWRGIVHSISITPANYSTMIDMKGNSSNTQIRALGNSKSDGYIIFDPKKPSQPIGCWEGVATTGYPLEGDGILGAGTARFPWGQGQAATWIPYSLSNPNRSVTQWGFFRCFALQAWNEFNWNGWEVENSPEYKEFVSSFLTCNSFVKNSNAAIYSMEHGKTFLKGTFSTQNDLITADISGVSLAFGAFGGDLIKLGKTIDLSTLSTFGLPSNLLKTLKKVNAITQSLSLALLSTNITPTELNEIFAGGPVTAEQEKKIYGAFGIIGGVDLEQILIPLNCRTPNLRILTELLDVKKMFPTSLNTLTVPVYNTSPGPTNSKTYYPIYVNGGVNSQILSKGFGDYLTGILPNDQAQAAGAFAASMQQIRNIQTVSFEKFAQITESLEGNAGLSLTNGTDVPTNVPLATTGVTRSGAGTGAYGTYTMSDLFGCMSGLPYPWIRIFNLIKLIETIKLQNIYDQLLLAVEWEAAWIMIKQEPNNTVVNRYIPKVVVAADDLVPGQRYQIKDSDGTNFSSLGAGGSSPGTRFTATGSSRTGAANLVAGQTYTITSDGTTDFTLVGAPDNNIGTTFVATGPATGSGTTTQGSGEVYVLHIDPYTKLESIEVPARYILFYDVKLGEYPAGFTPQPGITSPPPKEDGGGYGRGGAPNPIVTITNNFGGASVNAEVGRDPYSAGSNYGGAYGRITFEINNGRRVYYNPQLPGNPTITPKPPIEIYSDIPPNQDVGFVGGGFGDPIARGEYAPPMMSTVVQTPPDALLPVQANGSKATNGQNGPNGRTWFANFAYTAGYNAWSQPMNNVSSAYMVQGNTEISSIYATKSQDLIRELNALYVLIGGLLTVEQRARWTAMPPVPINDGPVAGVPGPKDHFLNLWPGSQIAFVDSIPSISAETDPHMAAQTLEAISDFGTVGGQSTVGQMRQERNADRLTTIGVDQDNNIPAELSKPQRQILVANGTIPKSVNGIPSAAIGPGDQVEQYTPPPFLYIINEREELEFPIPEVIVNPNIPARYDEGGAPVLADTTQFVPGTILPILDTDYTGPNDGDGTGPPADPDDPTIPVIVVGPVVPRPGGGGGSGTGPGGGPGAGTIVDVLNPIVRGAVNQPSPVLPINLNRLYTSSTLLPSSYGVQEAIEKVIECNCDCWID